MKLKIEGMHCASCEVLIEQAFKKIPGVDRAQVHHTQGKAIVECSQEVPLESFQAAVAKQGYRVKAWEDLTAKQAPHSADYFETGSIALVFVLLYFLLKPWLPADFGVSTQMSYGFVFVLGLMAAVSSCMAVSGGLLLAVAAKYNELHPNMSGFQKFQPTLYFNLGRIVSYTALGGVVGLLGSAITLSARWNGLLIILVSVVMVSLGFQLLNLFPRFRLPIKMPKALAHWIYGLETKNSRSGAFALGALTFFLPCGFTQALQLYVLSTGSFVTGALTMLVFALGTLPALLSLSAASSFAKGNFQKSFLRFAGVAVVLLGLFNIKNGLILTGVDVPVVWQGSDSSGTVVQTAKLDDGKQILEMTVSGYSYSPRSFEVREGVPVEWRIDGRDAAGCGRVLVMSDLDITQYLDPNQVTVLNFTPTQMGTFSFNCSMGMMTPGSFTVVENANL